MSYSHNICVVAQVVLGDGTTYYLCSSSRVSGFTMDGNTYNPYILSIGDLDKIGNFGEGSAIGNTSMTLLLGQKQYQGAYNLDIRKPWNNGTCTIKIRDVDSDTLWADCEDYMKGIIKDMKISNDTISFNIEDKNQKDDIVVPITTVEDLVFADDDLSLDDIPEDFVGKRVPMQFGYLDESSTGIFAKTVTISNKIGKQKIFADRRPLFSFSYIGSWDNNLKRFFNAISANEFTIDTTDKNYVDFSVDSTTTLYPGFSMAATEGLEQIQVVDGSVLTYTVDEDPNFYTSNNPALGTNVISIDNELMLILEQPDTSGAIHTVWVERGYNNTNPAVHNNGAKVYQSSRYASKNFLSFTERFIGRILSNPYHGIIDAGKTANRTFDKFIYTNTSTGQGKLSNMTDNSDWTKYTNFQQYQTGSYSYFNVDIKFDSVEKAHPLINLYVAFNGSVNLLTIGGVGDVTHLFASFFDPSLDTSFNEDADTSNSVLFLDCYCGQNDTKYISLDSASPINDYRTKFYDGSSYIFLPPLVRDDADFTYTLSNITDLGWLNKKWKLNITFSDTLRSTFFALYDVKIYKIGLWADFLINFTEETINAILQGRERTTDTNIIFNESAAGECTVRAWKQVALVLLEEMGYAATDFDYPSWRGLDTYYLAVFNDTGEERLSAISYGIDDSEKGWDFCQMVGAQHGFTLVKTDAGKIKAINLYQLQDKNATYGYPSLTAYKISLDDIVMGSGKKLLSIQQTGTDRIRNVVSIKYKMNHATGEYQSVYPPVQSEMDTYVLKESGLTLAQARTRYYNGEKTETLEIDAFSIAAVSTIDPNQNIGARMLWEWHINDKAEVFFYATFTLPYYHYSDVNGKSAQYEVGDVIYLDGIYQGVTYDILHKWVVRNLKKADQGKELIIECKSIQPVSMF